MLRRGLVALVVGACTPADDSIAEPGGAEASTPTKESIAAYLLSPAMQQHEPPCRQSFPSGLGIAETPWIWNGVDDYNCRAGCSVGVTHSTWSSDGLTVSLLDHGAWMVDSDESLGVWEREVDPGDFVPTQVRWTSWCGPVLPIVFAAHDARQLRLVVLERTTGEEIARAHEWLAPDRSTLVGFDLQMYCTLDGVQLHAKSERGAWWSSYSSLDLDRLEHRELPDALARPGAPADDRVTLPHLPRGEERLPWAAPERERIDTADRRYDRVGTELFALAPNGDPLWHRDAELEPPGCRTWGDSLMMCSRCPTPSQHLSLFEEWVVVRSYDIRSTLDVFDRDGVHLVHLYE